MTVQSLHAASDSDPRYVVPGLARGVDILRLFHRDRPIIAAPDMARELGIPRSTVFRLAQTLEGLGLLARTDGGRAFRLGVGVLSLGFEYLASLDVTQIGVPYLEALRDETGLSVHMVVPDGEHVVVVHRCPGRGTFPSALAIGKRLPAHATVLGRAVLSSMGLAELEQLYGPGRTLESHSSQTPKTLEELADALAEDARRGAIVSRGFYEPGISSVAAPVHDATGRVVAGINVTVHVAGGETLDDEAALADAVRDTAARISAALSYRPDGNVGVPRGGVDDERGNAQRGAGA